MKQVAVVTRLIGEKMVEVTVARQSACAHDCTNCAGCGAQTSSISVYASCSIDAAPGDLVEIYSDNRVLRYAALVYLVPLVLFLAGYFAVPALTEEMRYLCGGIGFAVGILLAILCDRVVRRKNGVTYQVIRKM